MAQELQKHWCDQLPSKHQVCGIPVCVLEQTCVLCVRHHLWGDWLAQQIVCDCDI